MVFDKPLSTVEKKHYEIILSANKKTIKELRSQIAEKNSIIAELKKDK